MRLRLARGDGQVPSSNRISELGADLDVEAAERAIAMADQIDQRHVQRADLAGARVHDLVAIDLAARGLAILAGRQVGARVGERDDVLGLARERAHRGDVHARPDLRARRELAAGLDVVLDVRDAGMRQRLPAGGGRVGVEDQRAGAAGIAGEREHLPHLRVLPALEVADDAPREVEAEALVIDRVIDRDRLEAEVQAVRRLSVRRAPNPGSWNADDEVAPIGACHHIST